MKVDSVRQVRQAGMSRRGFLGLCAATGAALQLRSFRSTGSAAPVTPHSWSRGEVIPST